jgi:DNA-binding CsgD family transcriptional regulator
MPEVLGREGELSALSELFEPVPPTAIVIEGEAGIGKTTLWRWLVDEGVRRGYRVLAARPSESESQLAFAGIQDVLGGVFAEVAATLPPPQQWALAVALLLEDPGPVAPDAGAVAAGCLSALKAVSRATPVLVAIDDVQWLDRPSAAALEFAVRRIGSAPVALAISQRGEGSGPMPLGLGRARPESGVRRLALGPMALGPLHLMLREHLGVSFPRPELRRIHEAARGNPFLALELARALQRRGGHIEPGEPLPVPATADELLRERLAALPPAVEQLLLAAAVLSHPTVEILAALGGDAVEEQVDRCVSAQVLERDGELLRFAHPLLASAVYAAADPADRRLLHRRLAQIVVATEERARHLALAADGPSASVAAELELAARLARGRGAPAAAAGLAERAVRLTPPGDAADAARRAGDAASYSFEAGDAARARRLLEEALEVSPPGAQRADVLVRLARVRGFGEDLRTAADLFTEAAQEPAASEETRIEAEAGLATALMRLLDDLPRARRHARAAVELARPRDEPRRLAEHLGRQALIETLLGRSDALALARRAAWIGERAAESGAPDPVLFLRGLDAGLMLGVALLFQEQVADGRAQVEAAGRRADDLGDESSLPLLLRYVAYGAWLAGDWEAAARAATEGYDVAVQTGQAPQQGVLAGTRALIAAHLGRVDEARGVAEEAFRLADETGLGLGFGALLAGWGLGVLELSLGNAAGAHEQLGPLLDRLEAAGVHEPGVARLAADDVEALILLGRTGEAETLLRRTEGRAHALGRLGVLALCRRCRGLLAATQNDPARAVATLERAVADHEEVPIPFERARTLVALGMVYRRARRKRAARETLTRAVSELETLGAGLWARQARHELSRIGGRVASDGLTPTERRIAELVAEGRSNKEVAGALFVTPKTVETNLSRIYAKLGVRSRTALARELAGKV